ncbi:hypothetical protein [Microcoleus sp. S36b_A4]
MNYMRLIDIHLIIVYTEEHGSLMSLRVAIACEFMDMPPMPPEVIY